jgi:DivIVA domain-containing protein
VGLTPADITNTSFTQARKGYDIREVDAFLRALAAKAAEEPPEQYGQLGDEVASVLRAANETASSIRAKAEAEAAAVVAATEQSRLEIEQARVGAEAEISHSLLEAETYAAETRQAADTYLATTRREAETYAAETRQAADTNLATTRREADDYATETRQAADTHDEATRTGADDFAQTTRESALEEARAIRSQAEEDAQRRSAALVAATEERVAELEGVEAEIRSRVQSMAAEIQRLADVGNGVIDLRDRRRPDVAAEEDAVPASRAIWTAVGDAMAGPETPTQESSAS